MLAVAVLVLHPQETHLAVAAQRAQRAPLILAAEAGKEPVIVAEKPAVLVLLFYAILIHLQLQLQQQVRQM